MRDLHAELMCGGESAILQLIKDQRQERVDLEFKTKSNAGNGEPNRDDRKNLGIVLSAMSNSAGGLIVWGVSARPNEDGVDCAASPAPISQIQRFRSDMQRLAAEALMPRHEGIAVDAVPCAADPNSGYLLIYVERSERRPHRCEFVEKQYFKRAGDSSFAMEHYDIADSFQRQSVAALRPTYTMKPDGSASSAGEFYYRLQLDLWLENTSHVTAHHPYFILSDWRILLAMDFRPRSVDPLLKLRDDREVMHVQGGADFTIHPDLSVVMISLSRALYARPRGRAMQFVPFSDVSIDCKFGCSNSRVASAQFEITAAEIAALWPDVELGW